MLDLLLVTLCPCSHQGSNYIGLVPAHMLPAGALLLHLTRWTESETHPASLQLCSHKGEPKASYQENLTFC